MRISHGLEPLTNRLNRSHSPSRRRRSYHAAHRIELLEDRALLSSVSFNGGALGVYLTGNDSAVIGAVSGNVEVWINAVAENLAESTGSVISIEVFGDAGNVIDLTDVTAANGFQGLWVMITGGNGADSITGSEFDDGISAGAGDDFVNAKWGADGVYGGDGNDTIYGGGGEDWIYGDAGDDYLKGQGFSHDVLDGGEGNDTLLGEDGDDSLFGMDGNDVLSGGGGIDTLYGGSDDDTLWSGTGSPAVDAVLEFLEGDDGCNLIDSLSDCQANAAPQPDMMAGEPYEIIAGLPLVLDGSASSDPDAGPAALTYAWDLNVDGRYDVTGVNPSVAWSQLESDYGYAEGGMYTVDLRVFDGIEYANTSSFVSVVSLVANDDSYNTDEDTLYVATAADGVLDNDLGNSLSVTSFDLTSAYGASVSVSPDGSFSYDPSVSWMLQELQVGSSLEDSFVYSITNSSGDMDTAMVTLTVNGLNDTPTALDDWHSTDEDTLLTIDIPIGPGVLSNDSDADLGAVLTATPSNATSTAGAAVSVNANGSFSYDPTGVPTLQALHSGETLQDTFTYTVADENGVTDIATVFVDVFGINGTPKAVDDSYVTDEDTILQTVIPGVLANDTDEETGSSLTVFSADTISAFGATVAVSADGSFTYDPNVSLTLNSLQDGVVLIDTFLYSVQDANGAMDSAAVTLSITGVNDAPVATDDFYSTDEDSLLEIDPMSWQTLLDNDFDPDMGDTISVSSNDEFSAAGANVIVNPDGSFTYDPTASPSLQALADGATLDDTFSYTISDGLLGLEAIGLATVTVSGMNDAPIAGGDTAITDPATPVDIDVLANDWDPDSDPLQIVIDPTGMVGGEGIVDDGGTPADYTDDIVVFLPDDEFIGIGTFFYNVYDSMLDNDMAEVTVYVGTPRVDLEIYNGQGATQPVTRGEQDSNEFDVGAFTVANLNDTDGDGVTDNTDTVVGPFSTNVASPILAPPVPSGWINVIDVTGFQVGDTVIVEKTLVFIRLRATITDINHTLGHLKLSVPVETEYIGGTVRHLGRPEVDLMKLVIHKPAPNPPLLSEMKLTVVGGSVSLWDSYYKGNQFTLTSGEVRFVAEFIPDAGLEVWVEATAASPAVRDIVLKLEYLEAPGVSDTVRATAVWAEPIEAKHNNGDTAWADFPTADPNDEHYNPALLFAEQGSGFGLRPITPQTGVGNLIVTRFTVTPASIASEPDVKFDLTRSVEVKRWLQLETGGVYHQSADGRFPSQIEIPNDDDLEFRNEDESTKPDSNGRMYQIDAPGQVVGVTLNKGSVYRANFIDWVRVSFDGIRPGTGLNAYGSRIGDLYEWHVSHDLTTSNGIWVRNGGDIESDLNDVGDGHISIEFP